MNSTSILLDTNVLVSLYNTKDSLHPKAVALFQSLAKLKVQLVVSNYILLETYTILSQRSGKRQALEFGIFVRTKKPFLTRYISEDLDEKTWDVFKKVKNKDISFVDCSIIALAMQEDFELATFDRKILTLQSQFGFKIFKQSHN